MRTFLLGALSALLLAAVVASIWQCASDRQRHSVTETTASGKVTLGEATDPKQVCRAIDRFTDASNENPTPFEWTKSVVKPGSLKHNYADL